MVSDTLSAFYFHTLMPSDTLIMKFLKHKIFVELIFSPSGNEHFYLQPPLILIGNTRTNPTVSQDNWQYWQVIEILTLKKIMFSKDYTHWWMPFKLYYINYLQPLNLLTNMILMFFPQTHWRPFSFSFIFFSSGDKRY